MSDVRMAKFETMIEDINSEFGENRFYSIVGNSALALIYDYNKCNEYAKAIMDKTAIFHVSFGASWEYSSYDAFSSPKIKIDAAKKFVEFRRFAGTIAGYQFIFWALMVLTVDKSNAEEHLSLICDFAQMLKISDEEFEDILQAVKVVYNEFEIEEGCYTFASKNTYYIMGIIFKLYNIKCTCSC